MANKIELNKTYKTRDGRKATVLIVSDATRQVVASLPVFGTESEMLFVFDEYGSHINRGKRSKKPQPYDLVEVVVE